MSFLPPDWTIQNLWALLPTRAAWCRTPAHVQLKECLVKTCRDMTVAGSRMHSVEVKGVFVGAERIIEDNKVTLNLPINAVQYSYLKAAVT